MEEMYAKISEAVISGDMEEVKKLAQHALDEGAQAREILDQGFVPGMDVVGQRMKAGDMFIPEVLRSAKTMHAAMDILQPFLSEGDARGLGTVIIGTVEGDLHDIGKNMVAMMLEGAGFKVVDLGTNVTAQAFMEAAKAHKPRILAMSSLLTTTMPKMGETMEALKEAGIRDEVKMMAGGAPVTQDFVDKIGADAYGADAAAAVDKAKALMAGN